ncbi:MAG: hypothetical protein J6V24_04080, partial [Clostridia bacterium]|nr:hypothetical protein [Clostridia bacterium]
MNPFMRILFLFFLLIRIRIRLRGHEGLSFLFLRADASFVCAAGPCGFGILQIISFFVFADGAREDPPRPGPTGRLQAAQGRSRLGN